MYSTEASWTTKGECFDLIRSGAMIWLLSSVALIQTLLSLLLKECQASGNASLEFIKDLIIPWIIHYNDIYVCKQFYLF